MKVPDLRERDFAVDGSSKYTGINERMTTVLIVKPSTASAIQTKTFARDLF